MRSSALAAMNIPNAAGPRLHSGIISNPPDRSGNERNGVQVERKGSQ